ncbi:MAG: exonuclease SbcCD subunit D [Acidobacteriota bacterium]
MLHTADWHVGKRLGRFDRGDDHQAALDALIDLADAERVDLVLVAGDLFDRPAPGTTALGRVLDALERLARPTRPVVAIAGNHDSAELFDLLAPLVRDRHIHLLGEARDPAAGGAVDLRAGDAPVRIACVPFVRRGRVLDFARDHDAWGPDYGDRMRAIFARHRAHLASAPADAHRLLTAHLTVHGAVLRGGVRGERPLHLTDAYAAAPDAVAGEAIGYVALGHIHAPQSLDAVDAPCRYAGSPLALDFGEADEPKGAVIVELDDDDPRAATDVRFVPFTAGRPLVRARGRWDALDARDDLDDAYLDLTVETDGPDPGLADRARARFARVAHVRADYPRAEAAPSSAAEADAPQPWDARYAAFYRAQHGVDPEPALLDAFRAIAEAADAAADGGDPEEARAHASA